MATAYDATKDKFASASTDPSTPARNAYVVTPSDTLDLTDAGQPAGQVCGVYAKSLYVGVAGDVTVIMAGDKSVAGLPKLYKAHPVGYLPGQIRRVMATGTAATNILAMVDDA